MERDGKITRRQDVTI